MNGHRVSRSSGLKTDSEEHDLLGGLCLCDLYGIEWAIDDANIAARGLHRDDDLLPGRGLERPEAAAGLTKATLPVLRPRGTLAAAGAA